MPSLLSSAKDVLVHHIAQYLTFTDTVQLILTCKRLKSYLENNRHVAKYVLLAPIWRTYHVFGQMEEITDRFLPRFDYLFHSFNRVLAVNTGIATLSRRHDCSSIISNLTMMAAFSTDGVLHNLDGLIPIWLKSTNIGELLSSLQVCEVPAGFYGTLRTISEGLQTYAVESDNGSQLCDTIDTYNLISTLRDIFPKPSDPHFGDMIKKLNRSVAVAEKKDAQVTSLRWNFRTVTVVFNGDLETATLRSPRTGVWGMIFRGKLYGDRHIINTHLPVLRILSQYDSWVSKIGTKVIDL